MRDINTYMKDTELVNGYVYHICNPNNNIVEDGYVGVVKESKGVYERFKEHATTKSHMRSKIKKHGIVYDDHVKIIFHGPISDCYSLEKSLRPFQSMGWNLAAGGGGPYYGLNVDLNKVRSDNQSKRMQDSELREQQSKAFKEFYYNDIQSQELRKRRATEHMANPEKKLKCLSALHSKKKCPYCEYTSNAGNVTQHVRRKHNI